MPVFFAFIFLMIGILGAIYSPYLLIIALLPFLYLYFFREIRTKAFFFLIPLLVGFFISFFWPKGSLDAKEVTGLVVYRKENYYYLLTLKGKYLVSDKKNEVSLFSLVTLTGYSKTPYYTKFEGSFDYLNHLKSEGISYAFQSEKTSFIFKSPFNLSALRKYALSFLNEDSKAFVVRLLFSENLFDYEKNHIFNELGLSSILSLSGFHLSFFIRFIKKLFGKRLKDNFFYLEIGIISTFLILSRFKYTLRRIFLLSLLSFINKKKQYPLRSLDVLSLVALILLIFEPFSLISPSFYYPFPFLFLLRIFPAKEKNQKAFSFFAKIFLFYLPIRLLNDYGLNLLSHFSQLLLIPLTHLLFFLAIGCLIVPQIGIFINLLVSFISKVMNITMEYSPYILSGKPWVGIIVFYYLLIVLALIAKTYHFKKMANSILVIPLLALSCFFLPDLSKHYEVDFINVGQGDATLVRYERKNLLIDTGGNLKTDLAKECLIPYFKKKKIMKIDYVFITHLDYDHYGALESLRKNYPVLNVIYASDFQSFKNNSYYVDDLKITNLNNYQESTDTNYCSGVFDFTIKDKRILIQGDAPIEIEKQILEEKKDLKADILKVGHHGSKTSSSKEYLKAVDPDLAIISAGLNNSYGHPNKETLASLNSLDIPYRRTDLEGSIEVKL